MKPSAQSIPSRHVLLQGAHSTAAGTHSQSVRGAKGRSRPEGVDVQPGQHASVPFQVQLSSCTGQQAMLPLSQLVCLLFDKCSDGCLQ